MGTSKSKIMKRKIFIVLILFLIVFTSCKQNKDIEIGFLIHSSANARWKMDIEHLNNRAKELGAKFIMRDAQGDENLQLKQAGELLDLGVDVLVVVAANQNTAGGIVRAAHEKGVKVISYDRLIKNADLDYLISFEYEKIGELMVEYVAERIPKGNCIVLWGDANDANAVFIKSGQERALKPLTEKGQLKIVYRTYIENWDQGTARQVMNKILDFSTEKIDAVISSNIPVGLGAYSALSEHGYAPGQVIITGMDATKDLIYSMLGGGMTMSAIKPIKELAYGAIDLALDVVKNNKIHFTTTVNNGRINVPAKLFAPIVIDKSNYENVLVEKGFFTKEEIANIK
jgi:D-xylose transport system substrate-binding protein